MLLGYLKPHFAVAGSENGPSWASSWHLPVAGYTHAYLGCAEYIPHQTVLLSSYVTIPELLAALLLKGPFAQPAAGY